MSEKVNHPAHYGGDTTYEVIKVIEAWNLGFNLGNTVARRTPKKPLAQGGPVRAGHAFIVGEAAEDIDRCAFVHDGKRCLRPAHANNLVFGGWAVCTAVGAVRRWWAAR